MPNSLADALTTATVVAATSQPYFLGCLALVYCGEQKYGITALEH